jgi:hypothetical protein
LRHRFSLSAQPSQLSYPPNPEIKPEPISEPVFEAASVLSICLPTQRQADFLLFSGIFPGFLRISCGFLLDFFFPLCHSCPARKRLCAKSTGHIAERMAEPIPLLWVSLSFFVIRRPKAGMTAGFRYPPGQGRSVP